MVFSSLVFLCIFLPIVLILHHAIPKPAWRNAILIITSLVFYAYGEPIYVILVIVSTILNYLVGLGMEAKHPLARKWILAIGVMINLGFLLFFKYAGLFVDTVNDIFSLRIAIGEIALPIGISFYTFQSISYIVDVYKRTVDVQKNYFNFLLFISLFPQKIAGPIVKYHDIAVQITDRTITVAQTARGMHRFIIGLAKKVLIANSVAVVANNVFEAYAGQVNILSAWAGALAYMMQIYFDFSGYTDMALGLGTMFGFTFKENFDYPYGATTMQDFWRKWHMTLSNWFKEYLYIPLGGSRKGKLRTSMNKVIVFFTTGFWHGAEWSFVVWGLIHGAFLLLEDFLPIKKLPVLVKRIYVLIVVCLTFVIFRADTLSEGVVLIQTMFIGWQFETMQMSFFVRQMTPMFLLAMLAAILGCVPFYRKALVRLEEIKLTKAILPYLSYAGAYMFLIVSMLSLASDGYNPFIYFRF